MVKSVYALIPLLLIISLFVGCQSRKPDSQDLIITTIYPYQLLVQQLVGDDIAVKSLIPPNASPHTWTPKPSDMQDLEQAKLIISNGLELESNISSVFDKYTAKHVEIAKLIDLSLLPHALHHDEPEAGEHEHHHGEYDPHLWTSPENMVNITNALCAELINRFPEHAETITANKQTVIRELMAADVKIMMEREKLQNPGIVTYHNSYYYFTTRYNIAYIGFVQASPGQEPTPRELSELGNRITTAKVKAVFVEPQINPKSAEILAREFGLKVISIDPLGATMQIGTISQYYLQSWEIFKSGL